MSRQRLQRSTLRRARRAGFTIVELLVASAITLVVLGLMVQITFSVLGTFDKVSGTISARTQAETVLRYLREDFQSIVWRRDDNVWLLATVQRDQTGINSDRGDTDHSDADWLADSVGGSTPIGKPGLQNAGTDGSSLKLQGTNPGEWIDLKEYRFGQAGVWLRFFTNRESKASDGDVAPIAVGYQIVRTKPRDNSTEYRYQFYRGYVRAKREKVDAPYSVADAGYDLSSPDNGGYNRPGTSHPDDSTSGSDKNKSRGDPGCIRFPRDEILLANNIIDFGVRFWQRIPPSATDPDTTPSSLRLMFPADAGKPSNSNYAFAVSSLTAKEIIDAGGIPYSGPSGSSFAGNITESQLTTGFPDFVDVFVRVLTDEGARLIEAYERGLTEPPPEASSAADKDAHWWRIAEEHSEVYTERIPLSARPY